MSGSIEEGLSQYRALFETHLIRRERTDEKIRFVFRSDEGVEELVRETAAREKSCCSFFAFDVAVHDDEIWWDAKTAADPTAQAILSEFYELPVSINEGLDALHARFTGSGLSVAITKKGQTQELSLTDMRTIKPTPSE